MNTMRGVSGKAAVPMAEMIVQAARASVEQGSRRHQYHNTRCRDHAARRREFNRDGLTLS
jgi:hypothetical protein